MAMGVLTLVFPGRAATAAGPVGDHSPPKPVVRPPDAVLVSSSGRVVGRLGSYCWPQPTGSLCADTFDFLDPATALTVTAGETLTLRFAGPDSPTGIAARRYTAPRFSGPESFPVAAANPTHFPADFPAGTSWLTFFTLWEHGDATYYFELEVVPRAGRPVAGPAEPVRRQPHFTG